MAWDDGLLPEQRTAAAQVGSHARLLAGPGTGKTLALTRRVCFLVEELAVDPGDILALTFTRAAARELHQRVEAELGEERKPKISTLHSFALRQLLRNSARFVALPQPLRIADDWEERNIILEDLKSLLGLNRIDEARELLTELSADWQSLTADEENWDQRFPNPVFLGAWQEHRELYGYILRAELVYQLKRALEQYGNFDIEGPPRYLLIDEYQDLNRCDLAVIKAIADRGVEVFVAGDDDQSIYGFRKAHPEGIRRFPQDYTGAQELALEICKRCDSEILALGLFVARQDYQRIEKPIRADEGREGGLVALLRFQDQTAEAQGVAQLCRYLLDRQDLQPDDILVLLRTDRNEAFSSVLRNSLGAINVPLVAATADSNPFNQTLGRLVSALLRLLVNEQDHLAWRTLFQLRSNNIGSTAIARLYQFARSQGIGFAQAALSVSADPSLLSAPHGRRIQAEVATVRGLLDSLRPALETDDEDIEGVMMTVNRAVKAFGTTDEEGQEVSEHLRKAVEASQATSVAELIRVLEASSEDIEQELEEGKVNILTMHRAKGLTAKAVIVVAAEDEYLPGRAEGEGVGDERRLLYVSLTRAKHFVFVTYCNRRTGQQRHTGRTSGSARRSLTRFLRDGPIGPRDGEDYLRHL